MFYFHAIDTGSICLFHIEIIVHIPAGIIPKDYYLIIIDFPDTAPVKTIDIKDLPANWNSNPISVSTQRIGNTFFSEQKALALKVPSAIIKDEWNYIINPMHEDFRDIKILSIEPFALDVRLFKK